MTKQKKPNKYDEKVKIDIPDSWGFDDTLKAVVKPNSESFIQNIRKTAFGSPKSPLRISGYELQCYVLEDNTRVISQRGLYRFLGVKRGGTKGFEEISGGGARLARFLKKLNVNDLEINSLRVALESPILYSYGNVTHHGVEAKILPEIVKTIAKAYLKGQLPKGYEEIGKRCEIFLDALVETSIIALVDEATGFQYVRDRDALNKILESYISTKLLSWTKRFPIEFYQEMFRLNKWQFNAENINKRPSVVGTWTKEIVYKRLPPGVVEELERRNPVVKSGQRSNKHHQWLTEDIGNKDLENVIRNSIAIMRAALTWKEFIKMYDRAYPIEGTQFNLEL